MADSDRRPHTGRPCPRNHGPRSAARPERRQTLEFDAVRRAALDAGISPAAVEAALVAARLIWRVRPGRKASPFALGVTFMTIGELDAPA